MNNTQYLIEQMVHVHEFTTKYSEIIVCYYNVQKVKFSCSLCVIFPWIVRYMQDEFKPKITLISQFNDTINEYLLNWLFSIVIWKKNNSSSEEQPLFERKTQNHSFFFSVYFVFLPKGVFVIDKILWSNNTEYFALRNMIQKKYILGCPV